ncbi:MAG: glutamate racemase [Spirochaetaceae bacterium]|nr:MAG: glutamate racemase [Spirochaetaceae bacterium]
MVSKPLLFYDSGAGGLPYLKAVRDRLPGARYVYLADRKNFPLGEKSAEVVRQVVLESVSLGMQRFDPCLIVIACNTASVIALQTLRERIPVPLVGVVPAVKPAALSLKGGKLAVVSTRQTATGPYLERLIQEFADGREVIKVPVADLVSFAEYDYPTAGTEQRLAAVRRELAPLLEEEVRAVVLGCTHFVLLEKEFRTVLADGIALIDSREGVTNRVLSLLADRIVESGSTDAGSIEAGSTEAGSPSPGYAELYLNGGIGEEKRYRAFADVFDLQYRGPLEEPPRGA